MEINPIIVIPIRTKSVRLPNKPFADINGKNMIQRVVNQALKANIATVIVASCNDSPDSELEKLGVPYVKTDSKLPSGTDRVYDALKKYDPSKKYNVVVNLQGDMPFFPPEYIEKTINAFNDEKIDISTITYPSSPEYSKNPNRVKAVICENGKALYFSRCPIPHGADSYNIHMGIYAYKRHAIEKIINTNSTYLENTEKLEQLRALEIGMHIHCISVECDTISVDTKEDLDNAIKFSK